MVVLEHPTSGQQEILSELEAFLLAYVVTGESAQTAVARAAETGREATVDDVSRLIGRLAAAGFFDEIEALTIPGFPVLAYEGAGPNSKPRFRLDLQFKTSGPDVLSVTDPVNQKTFPLYKLEFALAKEMDGTRTLADLPQL